MTEPGAVEPSSVKQSMPKGRQIAWMIVGGIGLAIGGCGMFAANFESGIGAVGAIAFVGGVLVLLIGLIRAVIYAFRRK